METAVHQPASSKRTWRRRARARRSLLGIRTTFLVLAPVSTLKQAQPSPGIALQSPGPTIKTGDHDPSQTTTVTGSTDPLQRDNTIPTRPTNCSRNGFKLELFYRDVEELDERTDRRARKRDSLLASNKDTFSSIYRARHEKRSVDPASDHKFLIPSEEEKEGEEHKGQEDENQHKPTIPAESTLNPGGTPIRVGETSLNARAAEIKEIESELVATSYGRLNPKMLDVRPSSSMTTIERDAWDKVAAELVKEMSDDKTTLGGLVNRIGKVHTGTHGETILEGEFEAFANIVAARVAEVRPGAEQSLSGLFKSSGRRDMIDGSVPYFGGRQKAVDNRLDIIIHGERTEHDDDKRWDHSLSFGELKAEPAKDLKDKLIGQMLRFVRKLLQNHPVSGRSVAFSLCGYLFRFLETNPVGFSTSACYDFRNPNDHIKIVTMIAYLAGTPFNVSQQWEPSPNQTITVRRENRQDVKYRLSVIERLAVSPTIWGRRTAVWSAQVVPLDWAEDAADSKGLPMIIKSTWLPKRCYSHELDICEVIEKARNACLTADPTSYVPNLPIPVGQIVDRISDSEVSLDSWETPDGGWQLSTLATFCEVGRHVDETPITVDNHIQLHTSLIRTLKWLAEAGIHYRDLNNGNVLRSKNGDVVLIDFGNSRYLKRPRGQKGDKPADALELSLDDAHSGTLIFMSRRIHALTKGAEAYRSKKDELKAKREKLSATKPTKFTEKREELLKANDLLLEKMAQQLAQSAQQHCYIDDAEAQSLLLNQQMLYTIGQPDKFRDMQDLIKKQDSWGEPVDLRGVEEANEEWMIFADSLQSWRESVDRCHKALATALALPDDGHLTPDERQCFDELIEIMESMGRNRGRG